MPQSVVETAVTTLASGTMVAIVTSILNARRSNQEKLWELRRVAYGTILAEMLSVEMVLDLANEYLQQGEMAYFDGEVSSKHNERIRGHMNTIRKFHADNYIILSDEFISLFDEFLHSIDSGIPDLLPDEEHEHFSSAFRAARPKLLRQARSEMPLPKNRRDRVRRWMSRRWRA